MHLIAQGLNLPQIQERIAAINHLQQQSQQALGKMRGDHGQGLSA